MSVQVYNPQVTVTLKKMVQRTNGVAARYANAEGDIDLTPWLGDAGAVRTAKALTDPAGGFSVVFPDIPNPASGDTVYSLIEPMDLIEIRGSRTPEMFVGGPLPLIMRGWVSMIRRSETMNRDGRPMRVVIVQGQDSGKLWQIHAFWSQVAYTTDLPLLDAYGLLVAIGISTKTMSISDFMTQLVQKVMNKKIAEMAAFAKRQIPQFAVDASVTQGLLIPPVAATIRDGTYWNMAERFADRPWNELFIRDQEDGPHLVFRPAPFKDINTGKMILPGAADPGTIDLDASQVVSLDMTRTDARIGNFFWCPPDGSSLDLNWAVNVSSLLKGSLLDFDYGNNSPALFGQRRIEERSALMPDEASTLPTMLPPEQRPAVASAYVQWYLLRALQLKAMNRDNSVLEDGIAVVQGWETLQIGQYLRLTRGDLVSEAYITRVAHTFIPFQTWTTNLLLQRGTGFLVRNKYAGSPIAAEGQPGLYQ